VRCENDGDILLYSFIASHYCGSSFRGLHDLHGD
jgi:hypothetical protein